jgi:hypothetical protein
MERLQSFDRYELVRDATTVTGTQRLLLDAIAWRAGWQWQYTCFPSYELLAQDTHCGISTLRRAAQELEEMGLISIERKNRKTNVFHLNIPLLLELKAKRISEIEAAAEVVNRFIPDDGTTPSDGDANDTSPFDDRHEEKFFNVTTCRNVEEIIQIIKALWPDNAAFQNPQGEAYLQSDMEALLNETGESPATVGWAILRFHYTDREGAIRVGKAAKLGLYIKTCFPQWLQTYGNLEMQ